LDKFGDYVYFSGQGGQGRGVNGGESLFQKQWRGTKGPEFRNGS